MTIEGDNASEVEQNISTEQPIGKTAKKPREAAALKVEKKKGPSAVEIRANVRLALDRSSLAAYVFPCEFPEVYHRQKLDGTKYRLLLEDDRQVIALTNEEHVASTFTRWATSLGSKFEAYQGTPKQVDMWTADWRRNKDPFTGDIATVLQRTSRGRCWHRLDFDMDPTQETPIFDALCSRIIVNRAAFLAWCGALFDPKTVLQQYVWLYGEGQNGKGSLFRFLRKLLGNAFATLETDERKSNQFTLARYVGKRLLVDSDCSNPHFVTSSTFKQLTGEDAVNIEFKGKDSYSEILPVMCAFGSNVKPKISSEKADLRRAIFVEFAPVTEADHVPNFEARLWEERAGILAKLWAAWRVERDAHPGRKSVDVDEQAHRILADETDGHFHDVFDACLEHCPDATVTRGTLFALLSKKERMSGHVASRFWEWLVKQPGVANEKRKADPGTDSRKKLPAMARGIRFTSVIGEYLHNKSAFDCVAGLSAYSEKGSTRPF